MRQTHTWDRHTHGRQTRAITTQTIVIDNCFPHRRKHIEADTQTLIHSYRQTGSDNTHVTHRRTQTDADTGAGTGTQTDGHMSLCRRRHRHTNKQTYVTLRAWQFVLLRGTLLLCHYFSFLSLLSLLLCDLSHDHFSLHCPSFPQTVTKETDRAKTVYRDQRKALHKKKEENKTPLSF